MKLHDNKRSFREAIELTAQDLEIYPEFVEKDYWICQILQNLSRNPAAERTVWKGGVDFAILGEGLSQNQQKKLVTRIGHKSTAGMEEPSHLRRRLKISIFAFAIHPCGHGARAVGKRKIRYILVT